MLSLPLIQVRETHHRGETNGKPLRASVTITTSVFDIAGLYFSFAVMDTHIPVSAVALAGPIQSNHLIIVYLMFSGTDNCGLLLDMWTGAAYELS
jgi:hypothetical protein